MKYNILKEERTENLYQIEFEYEGLKYIISCILIDKNRTDTVIYRVDDNGNRGDINNAEPQNVDWSRESLLKEIEMFCDEIDFNLVDTGFIMYQKNEEPSGDYYEEYPNDFQEELSELELKKNTYNIKSILTIYDSVKTLIEYGETNSRLSWARMRSRKGNCKIVYELKKNYTKEDRDDFMEFLKQYNYSNCDGFSEIFGNIVFENGDFISMRYDGLIETSRWEYTNVPKY